MAPLRLLAFAVLLLGLLYTHAASPHATVEHLTSADSVSAADAAHSTAPHTAGSAAPGHDGTDPSGSSHGDHHVLTECAVGQPPHGPDLTAPCASPLDMAVADGDEHAERGRPSAARDVTAPPPDAAQAPVLRI
ncbi:DUF6153 family protein [Streptomyces sp. G45]|uniref:DUF6153 family protein n=1 Tax=Streptomyces sp. G45 TaxID=3406627 RepID=UPI003C17F5BF